MLKFGGYLDHELVQHVLFRDFIELLHFFKMFQTTLFSDYSFRFHSFGLKRIAQLDYEVMRRIVFRAYRTPYFDRVTAL